MVAPSTKGTYTRKPERTRPSRSRILDSSEITENKGASTQTAQHLDTDIEKKVSLSSSIDDGTALVLDEETNTLVNPYRYPSSVLEVDPGTGHWKIKPVKRPVYSPHKHISQSSTQPKTRSTLQNNSAVPPVPHARSPTPNWPLCETELPKGTIPVLEHVNRTSSSAGGSSQGGNPEFNAGIQGADLADDVNAISCAIGKMGERAGQGGIRRHSSDPGKPRAHGYDSSEDAPDAPSPQNVEESRLDDRPGGLSRQQLYRLQVKEVRQRLSSSPSASASGARDQESDRGPDTMPPSQEWVAGQTEDAGLDKGRESPNTPSSVYSRDVGYRTSLEVEKDTKDNTDDHGNDNDNDDNDDNDDDQRDGNHNDSANDDDNGIDRYADPNHLDNTNYREDRISDADDINSTTNNNSNPDNNDDYNNDMPEDDNLSYGTAEEDF
jgi:hypothetical protein